MKKLLLAAAALALAPSAAETSQPAPASAETQPAQAQPAPAAVPDVDPAIWVVRDEDTTIYLFGTFHLLDGRRDWFNDEVRTAFDSSSELVIEMIAPGDAAEVQQIVAGYARAADGQLLSRRLPAELNGQVQEKLAAIGIPAEQLDRMDPWFVGNLLSVIELQKLGFAGEHGVETVLTAAARERGMRLGEVETFRGQLEMFDTLPEALQVAQLEQTIEMLDRLGEVMEPLLTSWSNGDTDTFATLMNDGMDEHPELYRLLLSNRNANWAEWIEQRMAQPGTVFMAVGAGHLGGRDSVQDFLARRGLRSERVAAEGAVQPAA